MWTVRWDDRIKPTRSGGSAVDRRPGTHRKTTERNSRKYRLQRMPGETSTMPVGVIMSGPIHGTCRNCTIGERSPSPDSRISEGNHRSEGPAVPASSLWPHWDGRRDSEPSGWPGRSLVAASDWRILGGIRSRHAQNNVSCKRTWRGGEECTEAINQCPNPGSEGGLGCSAEAWEQRTEIARLPRLFRVGSDSVERLDRLTPDSLLTQEGQFSRQAVEDVASIPLHAGHRPAPETTTRPGGHHDSTGGPTNLYTTSGCSCWVPR